MDLGVCVGSPAPFHAFSLARQLEARGVLERLLTTYPARRTGLSDPAHVTSFPYFTALRYGLSRIGLGGTDWLEPIAASRFDRWMSKRVPRCDVFHCMSGFGTRSHRVARERWGAVTVCDRGSTHISYQDAVLREEYGRWGVDFDGVDRRALDRELDEYAGCDAIFVPSSFALRTFVDRGIPVERLRRIPYGVDLDAFSPPRSRPDRFTVLHVGAVGVQKGIGYLLDAFNRLDGSTEMRLRLVGRLDRGGKEVLARFDGFEHVPGVPKERVAEVYRDASVFVLASVQEGLALVLAEAMASGLPVLATVESGAEDLIDDGVEGYVVPARDPAALAERIGTLSEDRDLREAMGAAARAKAAALGGWDRYADEVIAAYEDLRSRNPS